jgi:uncharacterized protein YcgL (UPF0745 family)
MILFYLYIKNDNAFTFIQLSLLKHFNNTTYLIIIFLNGHYLTLE